ncbi:MAG: hypothetical protein IPH50_02975 [Rhodanobacteraceae bacterium]|nr:hypothetical protein [Rhodanobacteraceae bacterium]
MTVILMHYVFGTDGTVTHFMHSYSDLESVYFELPNLYCISILADVSGGRQVIGGLFVKTQNHHNDPGFVGVMSDAALSCDTLRPLMNSAVSIAPSLVGMQERIIPHERDMLKIAVDQLTLRSRSGSA